MPTAEDIANPSALIARLQASSGASDELDKELRDLLGE
jgi:hypothetical protein